MKKVSIIIIVVAVLLICFGTISLINGGKKSSTNEVDPGKEKEPENKEEKPEENPDEYIIPYEKDELFQILGNYAMQMYESKEYTNCKKSSNGSCFISLEMLEKDYGKDISKFKDKKGDCLLDKSGITFNDGDRPFSFVLEGCRFYDLDDEEETMPEESKTEEPKLAE